MAEAAAPDAERLSTRAFGDGPSGACAGISACAATAILAANAWVGGYELDLVVRRGSRIVVCEVKAKGGRRTTATRSRWSPRRRRAGFAARPRHGSPHAPSWPSCEVSVEAVAVRGPPDRAAFPLW